MGEDFRLKTVGTKGISIDNHLYKELQCPNVNAPVARAYAEAPLRASQPLFYAPAFWFSN